MRMIAALLLSFFISTASLLSAEWIRVIDPSCVEIVSNSKGKVVEIETWKLRGYHNFVNLSFWGSSGPVGFLRINSTDYGKFKKHWPVLVLSPYVGERTSIEPITGFSGSNVLVKNGRAVKQNKSFFSRRRCPRTGIGVRPDGMLVVIVTTSSNLRDFAEKFVANGVNYAINVDGGSSTMFIENGVSLWNSKRSAVPVILAW